MRPIEQIAIKTADVTQRIKDIEAVYEFNGRPDWHRNVEQTKWVLDRVHAVHVFTNPDYTNQIVGSSFEVQLAFNYDLIPLKELELIQLLSGQSVQLPTPRSLASSNEGLSHLGYHIKDGDSLMSELAWWNAMGYIVAQVSQTTSHSGTSKRYTYAFVDTRAHIGAWTKVIARMTYERQMQDLVEEFSRVNYRVRAR